MTERTMRAVCPQGADARREGLDGADQGHVDDVLVRTGGHADRAGGDLVAHFFKQDYAGTAAGRRFVSDLVHVVVPPCL